jgi:hypothetical protein
VNEALVDLRAKLWALQWDGTNFRQAKLDSAVMSRIDFKARISEVRGHIGARS